MAFSAGEARLPPGSRIVTVSTVDLRAVSIDGRHSEMQVSDLPLRDPIAAGVDDLVAGRPAAAPGEVVLGTALAHRMQVGLGDELVLARPVLRWRVVGLVEPVGCLRCTRALVAPGAVLVSDRFQPGVLKLVDLPPMSPAQLRQLQPQDESLKIRAVEIVAGSSSVDGGQSVRWSLVLGALVLTVAGIVISAAFAVGARRQLVTLGQLAASGASPATVRTALVLQGTVTGVVGAIAGLVLWAAVLITSRRRLERLLDARVHHYTIRPVEVLGAAVLGVAAATVAALIPARTAAGLPTLAALAGRRPLTPVSVRQVSRGAVAFVAGLALLGLAVLGGDGRPSSSGDGRNHSQLWAFVAILGGVAELLGACALAPVLVARFEPLAARMRGSWRLAGRSLSRHRSRSGAVVSAVSAAGALAIAAAALTLGARVGYSDIVQVPDNVVVATLRHQTEQASTLGPVDAADRAELARLLPGSVETVVRATTRLGADGSSFWSVQRVGEPPIAIGGGYDRALAADEALLDLVRASGAVRSGLATTGFVVLSGGGAAGPAPGRVVVGLPDGRRADAVVVRHRFTAGYLSDILVSPPAAARLGLALEPIASAFTLKTVLTETQRYVLDDLQYNQAVSPAGAVVSLQWSSPWTGPTPLQLELILTGLALACSMFVVGVSLALAAAESKDERDVLTMVGAPPGALARSAGARAWLLAAAGGAMAIPVGFLPVVVFSKARASGISGRIYPIVFPGRTALLLVLVVPCVVALASMAASATAQRLRPVRVSTATFE